MENENGQGDQGGNANDALAEALDILQAISMDPEKRNRLDACFMVIRSAFLENEQPAFYDQAMTLLRFILSDQHEDRDNRYYQYDEQERVQLSTATKMFIFAFKNEMDAPFLLRIMENNPECVTEELDSHGRKLLHIASQFGAPIEVIRHLVGMYPAALRENADYGLPLYYACDCLIRSCTETIKFLLSEYPDAASTTTRNGNLPLHGVLMENSYNACLEVVALLTESFPNGVRAVGDGSLPLHLVCESEDAQMDIVEHLLTLYPGALGNKGNCCFISGRHTPLQMALFNGQEADIIRLLIRSCPTSALQDCDDGNYPLHIACQVSYPIDIMKTLLDRAPDVASTMGVGAEDVVGLPLHVACTNPCTAENVETIRLLLNRHPRTASSRNIHGELPIHVACKQFGGGVRDLVQSYPEGVLALDANGEYPLLVACKNRNCSLEWIRMLVEAEPLTVFLEQADGSTPLHLSHAHDQPQEISRFLLNAQRDAVRNVMQAEPYLPDLVIAHINTFF